MTLSVNINDREFAKFCEVGGATAVRTCTTLEGGGIEATPSGLTGRRTGFVVVGDTPTRIDSTLDRESIVITNEGVNLCRVGGATVAFSGVSRGYPVGPNEGLNEDTKEDAPLYAICDTGKTTEITYMEYYKA